MTTHALTPALAAAHYTRDAWSQTAIAAAYGVSQMTVSRYLRGVSKPRAPRLPFGARLPPATSERLLALRRAGWGYRRIGRALGVSHGTAWRWVQALEESP